MNKTEIENKLLEYFYGCWESGYNCCLEVYLKENPDAIERTFGKTMENLEKAYLLENIGSGYSADITGWGVIETEKRELISKEKVTNNNQIRYKILEYAIKVDDEDINDGIVKIDHMEISVDGDHSGKEKNLDLLDKIRFISFESVGTFVILDEGRRQFDDWKKRMFFGEEFERISKLKPQSRGIALEKFLSSIINEYSDWNVEHNVQTSYEQIDLVINQGREFYLIECKWEKKPGQPGVADKLIGKLSRRNLSNGILMSMSGFTSGAILGIRDSSGKNTILLFGKKDIEQIVSRVDSFDGLLDEKYKVLVSKRKVLCDGELI